MLNLNVFGRKACGIALGLSWVGLLVGTVAPARAEVTYSNVFAFDLSFTAGGVVASGDSLYGAITNSSLVMGGAIYKVTQTGGKPQTIYQLTNEDGYTPSAPLLAGSDGYLYGSTLYAARVGTDTTSGVGTLFRVRTDGTGYQKLHTFDDDFTTELVTVGEQSVSLVKNTDGVFPGFALIEDSVTGYLYGVTASGGENGTGVIFRIQRDGADFEVLHHFAAQNEEDGSSSEGAYPSGPLLLASDGRLYGVASNGGSNLYTLTTITSSATTETTQGTGTVFSLNTDGSDFQTIYNFSELEDTTDVDSDTDDLIGENGDGAFPAGGLMEVSAGVLVGTTADGGVTTTSDVNDDDEEVGGLGTIFQLETDGTLAGTTLITLHNFEVDTGYSPKGRLVLGDDGRLYGISGSGSSDVTPALNYGSAFSLAADGSDFTVEHAFTTDDGAYPKTGLTKADSGDLFGATTQGACINTYNSYGAVYRLSFTGATSSTYADCTSSDTDGGGAFSPGWLLLLSVLGLAPVRRRVGIQLPRNCHS